MKKITADVDYVDGHLRRGHKEAIVTDEQAAELEKLSREELAEWLQDNGKLVIDDYRVNDYGDLGEITVEDHEENN